MMKPRRSKSAQIHIGCTVENFRTAERATVTSVLVDEQRMFTWLPARTLRKIGVEPRKQDVQIQMTGGTIVKRSVGFVILHVEGTETADEVVFAEKGDPSLLGCRALEGLKLRVDPQRKRLEFAGPIIAAAKISKRKP